MLLTSRVQNGNASRNQNGSEGYVLSHHKIPRCCMLRDILVRDIRAAIHPYCRDEWVSIRRCQPLVGDKNRFDLKPAGCAEYQLFDIPRSGIGIDPDSQRTLTQKSGSVVDGSLGLCRPLRLEPAGQVTRFGAEKIPSRSDIYLGPAFSERRCLRV